MNEDSARHGEPIVVALPPTWIRYYLGAYGAFVMWRTTRLGLFAFSDDVVVRNFFKTRRIPKTAVDGFRIGSPSTPLSIGRTIVVLVSDDTTVSADALMWNGIGTRGHARLEGLAAQLREWRDAAP